jgi:rhodanese-related sulfurtransferase
MSLLSILFGSKTPKNDNIKLLSPEEFKAQIKNKKVQLVDVRTPREFNQGCIEESINIDFYSGKFNVNFDKLDRDKAVYVYCRSGSRSRQSANKLSKMGFTELYDLKGGFMKWR